MRESPTLLLDVSRTVARARLPVATGIDRVERAYIRWVSLRGGRFLASVDGRQYLLEVDAVADLLGWLEDGDPRPALDLRGWLTPQRDRNLRSAQSLVRRSARCGGNVQHLARALNEILPGGGIYLNTGHDNLGVTVMSTLREAGFRTAVMIHDTIPLDHPEYAREGTVAKFRAKLDAALSADLLIANSTHTADRLKVHGAAAPAVIAPLGIEPPVPATQTEPPAFVTLGTIEPRKNHLLLLHIWQRFWEEMGETSPRLVILGRRGWENRAVFDLLDSTPMMGRTVIEAGTPDDAALAAHLAGATALLFPSHAEGFGLPLAEALAANVPVIASDLPALREVGASVPEYLPPDDANAWAQTILAYASEPSPQRAAQQSRMADWQLPDWRSHFRIVGNAIETTLAQGA